MADPVNEPRVITVSTATIVKVVVIGLVLWFIYAIRDIVALFFVALMFASIINPLGSWFETRKMNRGVGVALLYILLIGLGAFLAVSLVPTVIRETIELTTNADSIWARVIDWMGPFGDYVESHGIAETIKGFLGAAVTGSGPAAGTLVATFRGLFGAVFSAVIVFVVTFYLVVSEDATKRLFRNVAPEAYQPYLVDLFTRIERALGSWARAQLILSCVVGIAVYAMLTILGVKYALVLALLAGIAESVPYVGPISAAAPAILIALTQSPLRGLLTAIGFYLIQSVENHVVVPKVMQKVTGLHPVVSIFSLLIGVKVAGPIGALLAIPVATTISVIIGDGFRLIKSTR